MVHVSDPHLFGPDTSWREVLDRRLIGYIRWKLLRQRKHDYRLLESLAEELRTDPPDHIIVTGDLTHLGLPSEFQRAREWLESLGPPSKVSVVPGNHDAYRWGSWEETFALWQPYFQGEEGPWGVLLTDHFPLVRHLGDLALIGLSTACPNFPPLAVGRLGKAQLLRFREILRRNRTHFRLVFLHHPPLPGIVSKRKALLDLDLLLAVLREEGCELLLFGHSHRVHQLALGSIPALGASSITCALSDPPQKQAAYFRLSFEEGRLKKVEKRVLS